MNVFNRFRRFTDSLTMYSITLYSLGFLVAVTLVLRAFSIFEYSTLITLITSLVILIGSTIAANNTLSKLYRIPTNQESALITGVILFFILEMPSTAFDYVGLALASVLAMASKYIFTWRSSLIFNPAAMGVFLVGITGISSAVWWIADFTLLIPTILAGFLILYKLRRFELFFAFLIPSLILIAMRSVSGGATTLEAITLGLTAYPLVFLGTVMLTEPLTLPSTRLKRTIYGAIVGVIAGSAFNLGFIQASPLTALLIGNVFTFLVTYRIATMLTLVEKKQLTPTTYCFSFTPDKSLLYRAGQYIDITLPGIKRNIRGNRRTFSITSHSSTKLINIGVKFYENGSAYKQTLRKLKTGDRVLATNIGGEFTLPKTITTPLVFVAGGIGITPFIPMIQEMAERQLGSEATLYYFVRDKDEIAYHTVLDDAKKAGVTIEIRSGTKSRLNQNDIMSHMSATFYLSGPPAMVSGYQETLKKNGITQIRTDYFTGY